MGNMSDWTTLNTIEIPTYFEKNWWSQLKPTFYNLVFDDDITGHVIIAIEDKQLSEKIKNTRIIRVTEREATIVGNIYSTKEEIPVHPNEIDLLAYMMDQDMNYLDLTMDFCVVCEKNYWTFIELLPQFLKNPEYADIIFA